MFLEVNICTQFQQKTCKNYHNNREDTVTILISIYIRNIYEIFIGIFISIPLQYIVYYHHGK